MPTISRGSRGSACDRGALAAEGGRLKNRQGHKSGRSGCSFRVFRVFLPAGTAGCMVGAAPGCYSKPSRVWSRAVSPAGGEAGPVKSC